jgi:two-component sensor histidine kinase
MTLSPGESGQPGAPGEDAPGLSSWNISDSNSGNDTGAPGAYDAAAPRESYRAAAASPLQRTLSAVSRTMNRGLAPTRVRLAGLTLVAAIPLLLLCATIAWQNYRLALDVSGQRVVMLREAVVARHAAAVDGAEQMLQALSQMPDLTGPDAGTNASKCGGRLADVLALQQSRYSNITFFDADGHLRCVGRKLPPELPPAKVEAADLPLLQASRAADALILGNFRASPLVLGVVMPAVYPVRHDGKLLGFLYAGLRMDWFGTLANGSKAAPPPLWLADALGTIIPIGQTRAADLPDKPVLRRLLGETRQIDAPSVSGAPFAYASSTLTGGYRLVVAYPAAADQAAARAVLLQRVLQLALFTALGLAGVAIGTHNALVAPLNALSRKVKDWRRTGVFDTSPIASAPLEVRALCDSFAEATQVLTQQERKLDAATEKQTLLMREIHHRVKNNLQIVASLLNLQASRIRAPGARAEFAAARDRVRALATLHRHLYSQGELTSITMGSFLTELCGQLFDAMGERRGGRIQLTIEAIDLEMSGDQAVPLSLVVTEAVSNAIKYAFPGGRHGHVGVFLTSDGKRAKLVIEDDGVGIPAGRVETETGTRDGLGLQLIRGFSKQLNAKLVVEQEVGTRYTLDIPLLPHAVGGDGNA